MSNTAENKASPAEAVDGKTDKDITTDVNEEKVQDNNEEGNDILIKGLSEAIALLKRFPLVLLYY